MGRRESEGDRMDEREDEEEEEEPALGVRIRVLHGGEGEGMGNDKKAEEEGLRVELRWMVGLDSVLFESFCGMIKREVCGSGK